MEDYLPLMQIFLTGFIALALIAGCTQKNPGNSAIGPQGSDGMAGSGSFEKVSFTTEDGFTIAGNLYRGGKNAVVLLPQFTLDRSSFSGLAKKLNNANFTVLALDLRGHGESLDQNGTKRNYQSFSGQDFRNMQKDVKAANKYLGQQGFTLYAIVGSSIGANTAVTFASQDISVQKIVLLSPGLDFKGIETESPARMVKAKALIVASSEDDYSFASGKTLQEKISGAEFLGLQGAGHGTNMFSGTSLEDDIVKWLGDENAD
ncbi:2-succinyl-6-hydroxy-2,4-cyclohexadiene-1-carboxylate synthase [uncultured archaeon]|nr:2-succinyl-6-hydroxy-2,4-cyclohexadiene-1-carboxylate synthase [uncultured archaeon]